MISLNSFAKVNLGLEIVDKRSDGYHNLRTIFQTIDFHDTLHIKENYNKQVRISGDNEDVSWSEGNTIQRMFDLVNQDFQLTQGFDIHVEKRIPPGSGLGGGSSNAAVTLLFLNHYFRLNLTWPELIKLAVKIGADVPFFLVGGSVLAQGIGEDILLLDDLEVLKGQSIGLVLPAIIVPTKLVFSHLNLTTKPIESKINTFLGSKDLTILENTLEEVAFRLFPEIKRLKEKMLKLNCQLTLMSGSGSALFCVGNGLKSMTLGNSATTLQVTTAVTRKFYLNKIGVWPSGKAPVFGAGIRRFESSHPSINYNHG